MVERREMRFTMDAYTPETIPMARLADYISLLAVLLGEIPNVHFRRLEQSSLALVQWIEPEAEPKVIGRLEQVRRGDGPPDALNAFKMINRKLRQDNSIGSLSTAENTERVAVSPGVGSLKMTQSLQGQIHACGVQPAR